MASSPSSSGHGHLPHLQEGSFTQEPGSGVSALVDGHRVSVGTLEWLQRQGAAMGPAVASAASASNGPPALDLHIDGVPHMGVGNSHSRVYVSVGKDVVGSIDVQVCA